MSSRIKFRLDLEIDGVVVQTLEKDLYQTGLIEKLGYDAWENAKYEVARDLMRPIRSSDV